MNELAEKRCTGTVGARWRRRNLENPCCRRRGLPDRPYRRAEALLDIEDAAGTIRRGELTTAQAGGRYHSEPRRGRDLSTPDS